MQLPSYQERQHDLFNTLEAEFPTDTVSTVSFQAKETLDDSPEMCLGLLIFPAPQLAADLYHTVSLPIAETDLGQYALQPKALHMTLFGIRKIAKPPNFTDGDVARVREACRRIIPSFSPFVFRLKGLFELPTSLAIRGYSDTTLRDLVIALRDGLAEVGVPSDKKLASEHVFFGNMTIFRYSAPPSEAFRAAIRTLKTQEFAMLPVMQTSLVTCNAVCAPASATIIETFKLGG